MKKHTEISNLSPFVLLIGGTAAEGILTVIFSLILALVSFGAKDPIGISGLMSIIALVCAGGVGGAIISRIRGDGGVGIAALSTLLFSLVLLIIGLITGGGKTEIGTLLSYALMIGAASLTALISRPRGNRKRHRR